MRYLMERRDEVDAPQQHFSPISAIHVADSRLVTPCCTAPSGDFVPCDWNASRPLAKMKIASSQKAERNRSLTTRTGLRCSSD
ncbi:hypothetical protein CBOM_07766 [Ceraceosorus bombacis]|uniref:Uncharacterized protein n=1 Tax=Ceraceosorus bombacis TaxID=401625 RepID=A0A0P1BB30_9BASI|nr:hypothetical protein CBOM_07766 [Ceraceosorus bombacis]